MTLCHDTLKGILRRIIYRAGVASSLEPILRRLPSQAAGGAPAYDDGARGDILLVLRDAVTVADVADIHPQGVAALTAASGTPGAAVAHRDAQKVASYGTLEPHGHLFVPFSVEPSSRLGAPAMKLLHKLGDEAAGGANGV
jgi:hypothetical protein